jgi:galactose mutarotase-like enzyme
MAETGRLSVHAGAVAPTGEQVEISHGGQRAVVTEVGGSLRSYSVEGREVLDGFGINEMRSAARGAALIPWPNRLEDGSYEFGGRRYQTPLSEPERHNAIHGLTRWMNWETADRAADRVVMALVLHPQEGYPFALALEIEYRLSADGLSVRTSARNVGSEAAPYGTGHHPYIQAGTPLVDEATLQISAASRLELDRRQNATGKRLPVEGTEFDFRRPRRIGAVKLDDAYTDLERNSRGRGLVVLTGSGGRPAVTVWMDESYPYVMAFTGDALPDAARRRRSLGVEPMTCAPNAFRSGQGLRVLDPGATFTCEWGLISS